MPGAINILRALEAIDQHWSPKVISRVNDQYVKIAKLHGRLAWHRHDDEDELFMVMKGRLRIEFEDRESVHLDAGEFAVVTKGVMHNPVADEECWVVLIETVTTKHAGNNIVEGTRSIDEQLA